MSENVDTRLILTTAGSDAQAAELARRIVDARAAACVNVVRGVCSFYRWKGEVQEESETLLVIKTTSSCVEHVRRLLATHHSYELPEFLVLPIVDGDPRYLSWIADNVEG